MKGLSLKQKGFFFIIYIATIILLVHSIISKNITLELCSIGDIVFFTILTALTESFTVVFKNMSISTTFAITITTYILFGPFSSILILVLGFLFRILKVNNNQYKHLFNTPIYGTVFNCCAIILPIIIGNYVFNAINNSNLIILQQINISIVIFGVIYFLINALVMSILMSLMTQKHIFYCLSSSIKIGIIHFIVMIPIGLILAMIFNQNKYWGIVCIIIPISLIRYTLLLYTGSKSQFIDTVEALMNAIDARDQYTEGHSRRVAEISVAIGKELKYNQWSIEELNIAAMLHDVGKIGVSDTILNKPGKLTDEEFDVIKEHPEIGIKIIKEIKNIDYVYPVVRNHHERYDGKGYPDGKKGDELPLNVYIVQLADTVDAMASDRPYRKGLSESVILEEINKYSGTQFHPKVAETYLRIVEKNDGKLP